MDYKHWINKWQNENIFNVENDRNKPKSYVFSFYPKANLNGFINGDIRCAIATDIIARYKRQVGYNVLFPTGVDTLAYTSFIESKRQFQGLTDDLANQYYDDMLNLGIGINELKYIDLRHEEFIELLQSGVIELYKKDYIKYSNRRVFFDKAHKKIYDDRDNLSFTKINMDCFSLDISSIQNELIEQINYLPANIKDELINKLNPKRIMKLSLCLSNGEEISYETSSPEYLAGIAFILINPEYEDITKYSSYDEIHSIEEFLDGKTGKFGVFSGIVASNPLTGEYIPIFISLLYDTPIYFGNPSIDDDDLALAQNEDIEFNKILENGALVDSDFLSNKTPLEAREEIFNVFIEEDFAKEKTEYSTELLISSMDSFGALFPFLIDNDLNKLYSLENYLPYMFSSKLRPILPDDIDIIGDRINQTMNSSFVNGFLIILNILYDSLGSSISLFSNDTKEELNMWTGLDYLAIKNNELDSLLYSLAIYTILSKELNISSKRLFKHVDIYNDVVDEKNREIKKNNNNLLNLKAIFKNNYHDSLRLLACDFLINEDMVFYNDLSEYNNLIDLILKKSKTLVEENVSLDFKLYQLKKAITDSLNNYDVNKYYKLVKDFILSINTPIGKNQFKSILILIYPLLPFTSEEIYKEIFESKYSIINEDWLE